MPREYDIPVSTPAANAVVPGSPQDPFYHSTGQYKNVTLPDGRVVRALDVGSTKPPAATEVGMISPSSGLVITGTERNMAKEREAMNLGITKEYIASRGGINSQGYYNDTPLSGQLTADEYKSMTLANGRIDTGAMARILQQKQIQELVDKGMSVEEATNKISSQYGIYGIGGGSTGIGRGASGETGASGGYNAQGVPTPGGQYNAQGQFVGNGRAGTPEQIAARQSAYDLLYQQFNEYGLGALVEPLKNLVLENVSPSEFTLRLRDSDAYKKRFAANAQRVANGLRSLSEAEYIRLEDDYQDVMRRYGLPESYYKRGDMGRQEGFEKFISGDVSVTELEDRILTGQSRVINAAPEIAATLRQFYPEISNGDILAYVLDPKEAITNIKRKITAAEIGAGATMSGLATGVARAEELAKYGITAEQARTGYQTIAQILPTEMKLSEIYRRQGLGPYTQTTAEQEVFGLAGAAEAEKQRKKLTELEQASFSGKSGVGALARDRAGGI